MIRRVLSVAAMGLVCAVLFAADKPVTVNLKDGTGKDVGTAKISDGSGGKGVRIGLNLKGLPAGEQGGADGGKCGLNRPVEIANQSSWRTFSVRRSKPQRLKPAV